MYNKNNNGSHTVSRIIVVGLLCVVGLAYMLVPGPLPLMGDDLSYSYGFSQYYGGSLLYYPRWVLRHWVMFNGRLANYVAPLYLVFMPQWLRGIVYGLMMMALPYLMIKASGLQTKQVLGCVTLITLFVLTLQWWDSFMLYLVMLNYVFPAVLAMLFAIMFIRADRGYSRISRLGLYVLSLAAGMGHEAASIPLGAGILAWLVINREHIGIMPRYKKVMLGLFVIGACLCVLYPGIFKRIGGPAADDSPLMLVVRGCYYTLILIVMCCIAWLVDRKRIEGLKRTRMVIFAVAAITSLPIVMVGGIVGRSGFFSQIYALVALALLIEWFKPTVKRDVGVAASAVMIAVVIAHLISFVVWERELGYECIDVIDMYHNSPDGVVYYDYTRYDHTPWYLLGKVSGVPDEDDIYLLSTIRECYGDSVNNLVILPVELQHRDLNADSIPLERGGYVTNNMPSYPNSQWIELGIDRSLIHEDGREDMIIVPFTRDDSLYYLVTPRVKHPENPRL